MFGANCIIFYFLSILPNTNRQIEITNCENDVDKQYTYVLFVSRKIKNIELLLFSLKQIALGGSIANGQFRLKSVFGWLELCDDSHIEYFPTLIHA